MSSGGNGPTLMDLAKDPIACNHGEYSDKLHDETLDHYGHSYEPQSFDRTRWLCFKVGSCARISSEIHYPMVLP
jgi:hypothetical protein